MKTLTLVPLIILLVSGSIGAAECDTGATPCEAYAQADLVFVGEVARVVPESVTMRQAIEGHDQTAHVRVERVFKGDARGQIVLHQIKREQAPTFVPRARYVFYANYDRARRAWWVKPCGRTLMADYAQDDLRFLEGLPRSAGRTRVAGRATRYEAEPETQGSSEPLVGLRLTITGATGEYEAVTDEHGMYELFDLPPGRYTLRPRTPAGLRFWLAMHYGSMTEMKAKAHDLSFEVRAGGCAGLSLIFTPAERVAPGDEP